MNACLAGLFHHCWQALGAEGDQTGVFQRLVTAYQEPQRRYHALDTSLNAWRCLTITGNWPLSLQKLRWCCDSTTLCTTSKPTTTRRSAQWPEAALTGAGVSLTHVHHVI